MSDTDTPNPGLEETLAGEPGVARGKAARVLAPGVKVQRYVLESHLGAGAMGVVWAAHDPELDRKLAIKFLAAAGPAQERVARLRREAQAMARLSHPNVVTVHDVGQWGESIFVAMEYVDGGTVGDWMQTRPSRDEVLRVFTLAARGLAAAHDAGIVHRDFKPDNVLMGSDGRVCVADFGLARGDDDAPESSPEPKPTPKTESKTEPMPEPEQAGSGRIPESNSLGRTAGSQAGGPAADELGETAVGMSARLTQTGRFLGTPAYMAPEQHLGQTVDARSDQFAFCVSLWEALFGSRPYRGDTVLVLALQVCEGGPPTVPDAPALPVWLRRVLLRGLSTDPSERFESMAQLLEELELDRRGRRRTVWLGLAGVACVATAMVATVALTGRAGTDRPVMCTETSAALDGVWTDEARRQVRRQFTSSGLSYAEPTLKAVEVALDAYVDEFDDTKLEACTRTHIRGEQSERRYDQQLRCFDRTKREFQSFVDALARADSDLIENAASSVEGLSPPGDCLSATADTRAPSASQRVEVDELYLALAEAKALRLARRTEEAGEILERVTPRAEVVDYAPVRLAAWMERASVDAQINDAHATHLALSRAIALAVELDDDLALGHAASLMIWATSAETPDEAAATLWRDVVLAIDGLPVKTRASALSQHSDVLSAAGRHEDAIAERDRAHGVLVAIRDTHPVEYAVARVGYGGVLIRAGRYEQANEVIEEGIEELELLLGPEHPKVTPMRLNLATSLYLTGHVEEAVELQRLVVADYERQFGAATPKTADARYNLGLYLGQVGEPEEGIEQLESSRAAYEKGGHTIWVAQTDLDIAQMRLRTATPDGALDAIHDARQRLEREAGKKSAPTLHAALVTLEAMLLSGEGEAAAEFARQWRPMFVEGLGEESSDTAKFELHAVLALLGVGESPQSLQSRLDGAVKTLGKTEVLASPPYSGFLLLVESKMLAPDDASAARAKAEAALEQFEAPVYGLERKQVRAFLDSLDSLESQ